MAAHLFHLHGVSAGSLAKRTWSEIRADDVFGRAAQLAYYFFLALFPFLICVIASLSVFGSADRGRVLLFGLFSRFLPAPAFALISTTFDQILQSGGPLKMSFGIVLSLWSASMGMTAVMDTLNAAYDLKETRSLLKQYAVAVGLTVAILLLLIASLLLVLFVNRSLASLPFVLVLAWRFLLWPLGLALLLLIFAITYYFAPAMTHREWRWLTPGALTGVSVLLLISVALRIYFHRYGLVSSTYGSLGAVILLLLSFYFAGIALLAGGALNGVLERLAGKTAAEAREESW